MRTARTVYMYIQYVSIHSPISIFIKTPPNYLLKYHSKINFILLTNLSCSLVMWGRLSMSLLNGLETATWNVLPARADDTAVKLPSKETHPSSIFLCCRRSRLRYCCRSAKLWYSCCSKLLLSGLVSRTVDIRVRLSVLLCDSWGDCVLVSKDDRSATSH